jgi:hypothetical protein
MPLVGILDDNARKHVAQDMPHLTVRKKEGRRKGLGSPKAPQIF